MIASAARYCDQVMTASGRRARGIKLIAEHNGRCQTLRAWSNETGIPLNTVQHRLRRGWPVADALGFESRPRQTRAYSPLAMSLKALGLRTARAQNKFVPDIYKRGSVAQRLALLQGLMDTDGSVGAAGTHATITLNQREIGEGCARNCVVIRGDRQNC